MGRRSKAIPISSRTSSSAQAPLALLYYLSDVLVLCRDIKGALISAAAALIITLATMIPLEAAFDMQGINYVVIIASLAGAAMSLFRLFHNKKLKA
jgi:hypothetical protein